MIYRLIAINMDYRSKNFKIEFPQDKIYNDLETAVKELNYSVRANGQCAYKIQFKPAEPEWSDM